MPLDDIGIGIRARIQGTEEGERLAQTFQKVSRAAREVGTQRPGFERWKRELEAIDKSIDRWHSKIQRMKMPFGKEDVRDVQKYGRMARMTLRAVDEERRISFQEKMRRLREEEKQAGILERDKIGREIELTQREQERWERERASYRRIVAETGEEEREVTAAPAPAARAPRMFGAPLGFIRGAGMAVGAGLGIAGGMSLFGFLSGSLRLWMEVDTISTRLAHKLGQGPGSLKSTIGSVGAAFKYTDQQAAQFLETYSALARTTDDRRFRTLMGYSRVTGIEPGAAFQFGTVQRLTSMDERQQNLFLNRFERHLSTYGLQPMREQMIQTVSSIGQLFLERVERPSPTAMMFAMQAVARIGGGPEGPEVYRGPEAFRFVQGLQTALGPGGEDPGRAFRLRAYGYGRGTSYWQAIRREYEGLNRPENLIDVLGEMGRTFGELPGEQRNLMYMKTWQKMGWGQITPDMVERLAKFTTTGGLETLRELRTTADVQKALKSQLGIDFAAAGQGKASTAEEINRAIHGAQRFVGEKIGNVVVAVKEGLEASSDKLANMFKAMTTGDFSEAIGMFKAAVEEFSDAIMGAPSKILARAQESPHYGLRKIRELTMSGGADLSWSGVKRAQLALGFHTMPEQSLREIAALPGGGEALEQLAELYPWGPLNVLARGRRSTLQRLITTNPALPPGSSAFSGEDDILRLKLDNITEAIDRQTTVIEEQRKEPEGFFVGATE